jgi:hypothetical protein
MPVCKNGKPAFLFELIKSPDFCLNVMAFGQKFFWCIRRMPTLTA